MVTELPDWVQVGCTVYVADEMTYGRYASDLGRKMQKAVVTRTTKYQVQVEYTNSSKPIERKFKLRPNGSLVELGSTNYSFRELRREEDGTRHNDRVVETEEAQRLLQKVLAAVEPLRSSARRFTPNVDALRELRDAVDASIAFSGEKFDREKAEHERTMAEYAANKERSGWS